MFALTSYCRSTVWGGNRLFSYFPQAAHLPNLAEAWIFSLVSGGECQVNGETLNSVLKKEGVADEMLTALPLIKLLNTASLLSVQVHPNDAEATALEGQPNGKNEMWYILDAEPGAYIYYNLMTDKPAFLSALDSGNPTAEMGKVFVKKGDIFMVPSGMVHALGGGITLLEIQQSSDLTYRLWDYGRIDADGKLRPLHTEKAKAVLKALSKEEIVAFQYANNDQKSYQTAKENESNIDCIANTPYFRTDILHITEETPFRISATEHPLALVCIGGEGKVQNATETYPLHFGKTVCLLPKDKEITVSGCLECVLVSL